MQILQDFILVLLVVGFQSATSTPLPSSNLVNSDPFITGHNITLATDTTISLSSNSTNPEHIRFNDSIYQAVAATKARYPQAVFLEVQASPNNGHPTIDWEDLMDVRLIFGKGSQTIYKEMTDWGNWAPPRVVDSSPPKNMAPLPSQITMDLPQADLLIKEAGFNDEYDTVDVRWPTDVPRSLQQVYYFFHIADEPGQEPLTVAVGTMDSKVRKTTTAANGDAWLLGNVTSSR